MVGRAAVFLDRDGTVIDDLDYLSDPEGVRVLPGAAEAIARLNAAGLPVVLVTNQSGIGRGYYTEADYQRVQARAEELLGRAGAKVTAVYHCPHAPDADPPCDCRKPRPGLFLRAAREHGLDLSRSWYVGDRVRDVEAGLRFGGSGYLIRDASSSVAVQAQAVGTQPDAPVRPVEVGSLADAVDLILRNASEGGAVRTTGSGSD